MPRVSVPVDLKNAISELTHKEKDKLIFRLLPKNTRLIDQLIYQLLENSETQEFRRSQLRESLMKTLDAYPQHYYSPGYLLMTMRDISGRINYHRSITGDKLGEIELNYLMINGALERNIQALQHESHYSGRKLADYVVKRIVKLLTLTKKLHEDYRLDFEEDMITTARLISSIAFMSRAVREHDLDLETLNHGELN